jgi:hypothetical protein
MSDGRTQSSPGEAERHLAQDARTAQDAVTTEDLRRFADTCSDLRDPALMTTAWGTSRRSRARTPKPSSTRTWQRSSGAASPSRPPSTAGQ